MEEMTFEDIEGWSEELLKLHKRIGHHFARSEPRQRSLRYLQGLLSPVERKNGWQLAERVGEATPDGMQRLLNAADWNVDGVRDELASYVVEQLGTEEAVLVVDETGFLKKGNHSAGVKRQYSGTAGGVDNCQVGVFLAYSTTKGTAFIDRELFLPEDWTQDRKRCERVGIPGERPFLSKPQLALIMLQRAFAAGVEAAWVTADSLYSSSRLRRTLEQRQQAFVLGITSRFLLRFMQEEGLRQAKVRELFSELSSTSWQRLSAGRGSKGERLFDWAWLNLKALGESQATVPIQVNTAERTGFDKWVLARRHSDSGNLDYYIVFAPANTSLTQVVQLAGKRWTIETGFEDLKQDVGLDEYETRAWKGWYRHITLSLLAHAFLATMRAKELKKGLSLTSCA